MSWENTLDKNALLQTSLDFYFCKPWLGHTREGLYCSSYGRPESTTGSVLEVVHSRVWHSTKVAKLRNHHYHSRHTGLISLMEAGIINVREMMDDMSGRVLLSNWIFWGIRPGSRRRRKL